jgi:hypothetical protein
MNKDKIMEVMATIVIAFLLYASVSGIRYRFKNPELTQTQCLINWKEMLKWK